MGWTLGVVAVLLLGLVVMSPIFWEGIVLPMIVFPPIHYAAAIDGRVIDAATGEPVPDVAVAVVWELETEMVGHRLFHLESTHTGADGRYHFAAWGPKLRFPPMLVLQSDQPNLIFFKPGYFYRIVGNTLRDNRSMTRHSDWDGHDLALLRAPTDDKGYAKSVGELTSLHVEKFFLVDCSWERIPDLITAALEGSDRLIQGRAWPRGETQPRQLWPELAQRAGCSPL